MVLLIMGWALPYKWFMKKMPMPGGGGTNVLPELGEQGQADL